LPLKTGLFQANPVAGRPEITVEIFGENIIVFWRQSSDVRGFLKVWERLGVSR
jgi:hypothetical protein